MLFNCANGYFFSSISPKLQFVKFDAFEILD